MNRFQKGIRFLALLFVFYVLGVRICQIHTGFKLDDCRKPFFAALEKSDFKTTGKILACEDIYIAEVSFDLRVGIRTWNENCLIQVEKKPDPDAKIYR
jgi:hypothetical protein